MTFYEVAECKYRDLERDLKGTCVTNNAFISDWFVFIWTAVKHLCSSKYIVQKVGKIIFISCKHLHSTIAALQKNCSTMNSNKKKTKCMTSYVSRCRFGSFWHRTHLHVEHFSLILSFDWPHPQSDPQMCPCLCRLSAYVVSVSHTKPETSYRISVVLKVR